MVTFGCLRLAGIAYCIWINIYGGDRGGRRLERRARLHISGKYLDFNRNHEHCSYHHSSCRSSSCHRHASSVAPVIEDPPNVAGIYRFYEFAMGFSVGRRAGDIKFNIFISAIHIAESRQHYWRRQKIHTNTYKCSHMGMTFLSNDWANATRGFSHYPGWRLRGWKLCGHSMKCDATPQSPPCRVVRLEFDNKALDTHSHTLWRKLNLRCICI